MGLFDSDDAETTGEASADDVPQVVERARRDPAAAVDDVTALVDAATDDAARVDAGAALARVAVHEPDAVEPHVASLADRALADAETRVVAEHLLRGAADLRDLHGVSVDDVVAGFERGRDLALDALDALGDPVPGGGATALELAESLRDAADAEDGRVQLGVEAVADAVEAVVSQYCRRAGLDPLDAVVDLRTEHAMGDESAGVLVDAGETGDVADAGVTVPTADYRRRLADATTAACVLLAVHGTVSQLDALDATG